NGSWPGGESKKKLKKYFVGRSSPSPLMPPGRRNCCISATGALSACQIPERSGLPLSRGGGADRFGVPSRVRGTVGSWYTAHWALTYRGATTSTVNNHAIRFLNVPP